MGNDAEMSVPGTQFLGILKSGGDKFHGSGMYSWESPSLQADNVTDALQARGVTAGNPLIAYHDGNVDLGGPVLKQHLWFYGSYRNQRIRQGVLGYYTDAGSARRVQRAHHEHDREADRPAESQAPLQRLRAVPDEGLSRAQRGRVSLQGSHLAPDLQAAGRQGRVVVDGLRPHLRERLRGAMAVRDRRAELHGGPAGLRHGDAPLLGPVQHLALRRRAQAAGSTTAACRTTFRARGAAATTSRPAWNSPTRTAPTTRMRGRTAPTTSSGSRTACRTRSSSTTTRTTRSTR